MLDKNWDAPILVKPKKYQKERPLMDNELLEEILIQLRVTNRLLATLLVEHHPTLKKQGYAPDETPLKQQDISDLIKQVLAAIS